MECWIKQKDGNYILKEVGEPIRGMDFCDSCGDCLYCEWGTPCFVNKDGKYMWVKYYEKE
jgi:hypothetical protein